MARQCPKSCKLGVWLSTLPVSTVLSLITLFLVNLIPYCEALSARDGSGESVRLRILEFDSASGKLVQVLTSKNSDILYGEDVGRGSAIVLECRSSYGPVAFSYRGDGSPEYLTNTNTTRTFQGVHFWTFLSFTRIPRSGDTGNYTCGLINNPAEIRNSVHLYIPDSSNVVFVPSQLTNRLEFPQGDYFRIPCSVVHPMASVSLERISENFLSELGMSDRVTYSPKSGFTIHMSLINPRLPTSFVCKGTFGDRIEEATYKIFSEQPTSDVETFVTSNRRGEEDYEKPSRRPNGLVSACTRSTCGRNAECLVIEYLPYCVCLEGYSGNATSGCYKMSDQSQSQQYSEDPCFGSPCGRNANCLPVNQHPVCACKENFYGSPPNCQSRKPSFCSKNTECSWGEQCDQKTRTCDNVCKGKIRFCGNNSRCFAVAHSPFCECLNGYSGNPYFTRSNQGCIPVSKKNSTNSEIEVDLCTRMRCGQQAKCRSRNGQASCFCPKGFKGNPNSKCVPEDDEDIAEKIRVCDACGPNSVCTVKNGKVSCECAPNSVGFPPNCAYVKNSGCRDNFDCPDDMICDRKKCLNPCPFMCSESAVCKVNRHVVKCECPKGFEGSPQFGCTKKSSNNELEHPCSINCGPNTVCREVKFSELQKYRETLRKGRQEALYFDMIKANGNLQGGKFSECMCRKTFQGNPYSLAGCQSSLGLNEESEFPTTIVVEPSINPCDVSPNPCGANSFCRSYNGRALCSCDFNSVGHPPKCKLRCQADSHCLFNESCIKGLCQN